MPLAIRARSVHVRAAQHVVCLRRAVCNAREPIKHRQRGSQENRYIIYYILKFYREKNPFWDGSSDIRN